ncbi:MAG: cation-translocating P-type ATPase [Verrucomicrobiota bacterium]
MSTCCSSQAPPAAPPSCCHGPDVTAEERARSLQWLRLGLAAVVSAQSMIFGLAVNLSPPDLSTRLLLHGLLALAAVVVYVLVGLPLTAEAIAAARRGRLVVEQLFLAGIFGAFFASVVCTFTGAGHVYYEVVAILLAIYTFGRVLGENRRQAAWSAATALEREFGEARRPDGATVPVAEIRPGDRVVVLPGEGVALDGTVATGTALVREAALTGESVPVVRRPGDPILAGGVVLDERLEITATQPGTERQLDRLLAAVAEARAQPSAWQREADRIVAWFLPTVSVLAIGTFVFWSAALGWANGLFFALAVLVVACPCALGLATPIAVWSALNALAKRGVVARGGDFVERLARTDTVVFDKTGTLSEDALALLDFVAVEETGRAGLLARIAAVEAHSAHPLAKAFHRERVEEGIEVLSHRVLPGCGVEAEVRAGGGVRTLQIGNARLLEGRSFGREIDELTRRLKVAGEEAHRVYVLENGRLAGLAVLRETLRPSAARALEMLATLGIRTEVMTGDQPGRAEQLALPTLPATRSGLSAEEKAGLVDGLRRDAAARGGCVLFVGDGINDSPAMARADAALALAGGSQLARETAGAQLYGHDLTAVPAALVVARKVRRGLARNLGFAAVYNFAGIALAVTGILHPIAAALLMMASSITVTWRALRLERALSDGWQEDAELAAAARANPAWTARLDLAAHWAARGPVPALFALAMLVQGPLVAYLAALGATGTLLATLFGAGAGAFVWFLWPQWRQSLNLQMLWSMLAVGNLGMLFGWSADLGFRSVVAGDTVHCACCLGGHLGFLNWMYGGMVLAGLPAMALVTTDRLRAAGRGARWRHAAWGLVGMVGGMVAGMEAAATFSLAHPQAQFFLILGAMVGGMLIGMFLACWAWQWWELSRRRSVAPGPDQPQPPRGQDESSPSRRPEMV